MGTIRCCCGHEITNFDEAEQQSIMEYTKEGGKAVSMTVYCKQCAKENEQMGIVLHSIQEEDDWMHGKIQYPIGEE